MAQLGDPERARPLLRRAARRFGSREPVARARCVLAEAEIALATRDLAWRPHALESALATLEAHGDRPNAAHARQLQARRLVLLGRLDEAEQALASMDSAAPPAASAAIHHLVRAEIALRRHRAADARAALARAGAAATIAGIAALHAEIGSASEVLSTPAARLIREGTGRLVLLDEVEALHASGALIIDDFRHALRQGSTDIALATRPMLFMLLRALAEAWPDDVPRDVLIARAFRMKTADETLRARLRVEAGRLRKLLGKLATVDATRRGYVLVPHEAARVVVLARPAEERHADVLALLADGEPWSSSALAIALGSSQRSVQRALDALASAHKVQSFGRGRARRWTTRPLAGFTTVLSLPAPLP